MDELVFAIATAELRRIITYKEQGLVKGNIDALRTIVKKGLFRSRDESEKDPSFKQIIPYAIISCKDSFFLFKRSSGQTEKRLQNLYSLGVGGHVNPGNSVLSGEYYFIDELKREFFEEVKLLNGCFVEDIEFIGFVNDDTIPVGRVHIGLLYNIRLSTKDLTVNETDKMTAAWIEKSNLAEFYSGMESWSRFVFDYFVK